MGLASAAAFRGEGRGAACCAPLRAVTPPSSTTWLPISTLMAPLRTVDLASGGPAQAQSERSDVTAVPAMGVIAEAMLALVLAQAMLEKFGGDSLAELQRNFAGYVAQVRARTPKGAAS